MARLAVADQSSKGVHWGTVDEGAYLRTSNREPPRPHVGFVEVV